MTRRAPQAPDFCHRKNVRKGMSDGAFWIARSILVGGHVGVPDIYNIKEMKWQTERSATGATKKR